MRLILASQSPYRRMQLENFGFRFEAHRPDVDEAALKEIGPKDLVELTKFLSQKKASSLIAKFPGDIILGSDQLAEVDGIRLDKPGNFENAKKQLQKMSGKEHRLITSLAILHGSKSVTSTDITRIRLRKLDDTTIESYLQIDQPYDCAGSYKIEKAGLSLVEEIHSRDPSAIQGLPMLSLVRGLQELGLSVANFWEQK